MLGGMAERPALDPRYDPAFQRGYDGSARAGSAPATSAPPVASALQRPQTSAPLPPSPAQASPSPDAGQAPEVTQHPDAVPTASAPAPVLRPPWTNPFVILIALLGIGAFVVGVWPLRQLGNVNSAETIFQGPVGYMLQQWTIFGSPLMIALGVAIFVVVFVMCALYWAQRPLPGDRD